MSKLGVLTLAEFSISAGLFAAFLFGQLDNRAFALSVIGIVAVFAIPSLYLIARERKIKESANG